MNIAGAVRYTGGNIFYYPKFNAGVMEEGNQFRSDIMTFLSRPVGFEAVLRIRASKGLTLSAYHGNFFLRSSDLLSLPSVSPDNSYAVQMAIEENLAGQYAVFQTALLHTSCYGQRRIRVVTSVVPITSSFPELYDRIDQGALVTLLSKLAVERALSSKLEDARDALINKCIDIMATYKTQVAPSVTPANQLSICDPMKQLPILILAMLKHPFLRSGSTVLSDVRIFTMFALRNMYVHETLNYLHPNFYGLHNLPENVSKAVEYDDDDDDDDDESFPNNIFCKAGYPLEDGETIALPPPLNLSSERLERHGLYILDDGLEMLLWVGKAISPDLCANLFDRHSYESLGVGKTTLPILDNPYSKRVRAIIDFLNSERTYSSPLIVVKEDTDPSLRMRFLWSLVEDRVENSMSYPQWLSHLREKVATYSG